MIRGQAANASSIGTKARLATFSAGAYPARTSKSPGRIAASPASLANAWRDAVAAGLLVAVAWPACSRPGSEPGPPSKESATRSLTAMRVTAEDLPSSAQASEARRALPSYVVSRLRSGETVVIDGKLDEPAWAAAPRSRDFVHPATGEAMGSEAPIGGSIRLRYDERALYFAFEARDQKLRGGFDPGSIDPHLWTRDTVEIMLDPDGDGDNKAYYELQINPQGLVFDSQFDDYNSPRVLPDGPFGHQDFDSHVERAVTVLGSLDDDRDVDHGYIVEAALPWKSLTQAKHAPPLTNAEWRANFYVMQDNSGVSWSPILGKGNFHKAARFGRLKFAP